MTLVVFGVLDAPPDPILNAVCLDRFSVDFGFARAGGQETITLTNNTDTAVCTYVKSVVYREMLEKIVVTTFYAASVSGVVLNSMNEERSRSCFLCIGARGVEPKIVRRGGRRAGHDRAPSHSSRG